MKSRLQESPPRTMSCSLSETVYIFSDASLDDNWNGGFGAVIFDERGFVLVLGCHTCSVGKMFCRLHLKER